MSDNRIRQLERFVEQEPGDVGGRFSLTREILRNQKGIVAFWHGEEKPHQSACKVSIGFEVKAPGTENNLKPVVINRPCVVGWMLAITSPADMLDIATLRGGCRLIDLETWRAVGLFGEAEAVYPEGNLSIQAATVDAFGRPRNTKVASGGAGASTGQIPMFEQFAAGHYVSSYQGNIFTRPKADEAIYDREFLYLSGASIHISTPFFQNSSAFSAPGLFKQYGRDTNCYGSSGGMPAGQGFLAKGISVFVDNNTPKSIVDAIKQDAYVRFRFAASDIGNWAMREVMPKEDVWLREQGGGDSSGDVRVDFTGSVPSIRPFSYAFPIEPLEHFAVEIYIPETNRISEAIRAAGLERVGLMVVIHGSRYMGVVG